MSWSLADKLRKTAGGAATPAPLPRVKAESTTLFDFLSTTLPAQVEGEGEGVYTLFTTGDTRNYWCDSVPEMVAGIKRLADRPDIYFGVALFKERGTDKAGRTQVNVARLKCFKLDLDAGEKKLKTQGPDKVYQDQAQALQALKAFTETTGLTPTFIVSSGEGLHVYYVLSEEVTPEQWRPVAKQFQEFGKSHGLKIDSSVTADHSRVLRPIGTMHPNGKRVEVLEHNNKSYTLAEFASIVGHVAADAGSTALTHSGGAFSADDLDINADLKGLTPAPRPKSFKKIMLRCAAMERAYTEQEGIEEPYWRAAIGICKHTVEGLSAAQAISSKHPEYDEDKLIEKFERWETGPSLCSTFRDFAAEQCGNCKHWGKISSPAQLGEEDDITPPGSRATSEADTIPEYMTQMNDRHALVRMGAEMVIADNATPLVTGQGIKYGLGWLKVPAFRQMYKGRTVEVETPSGETKKLPLADVWLNHTGRRQYDGAVFAPGEEIPDNILNLYEGFAVLPQAGDVSPWLQLLDALIPDATDREYVVKWLAWKVQNPGGVPDTVLIMTGKKGTGKNSLFEPVLTLFGKHGMLVDNPELIAGRFTGHMMDKCLAVMDEAIFTKDPRQQDCIKSRTTAKVMMFEAKGLPPVSGINRCAYIMLTNHEHVWQATTDERRAVVIEVGAGLKGKLAFWETYHAWCNGDGPASLLHYLQRVNLTGFNPRLIPKGEALRKQIEMTALRDPAVSWWHQCLTEGAIRWRDAGVDRAIVLATDEASVIDVHVMRESYEQGGGGRGINGTGWAQVAKRLHAWCGPGGLQKARPRGDAGGRLSRYTLPPLDALREHFTKVTNVIVEP